MVNVGGEKMADTVGTSTANTGIPAAFWANSGATSAACIGGTPPANCQGLEELNTLANILAACVESSGLSSTPCSMLFTETNSSITTLRAAHVIATNPATNVSALFGLQSGSPPFTPAEG